MSFGYSATKILAGRSSRKAIRKASRSLLEDVKTVRADGDPGRPIVFIAHDLGGIIVKDVRTVSVIVPVSMPVRILVLVPVPVLVLVLVIVIVPVLVAFQSQPLILSLS